MLLLLALETVTHTLRSEWITLAPPGLFYDLFFNDRGPGEIYDVLAYRNIGIINGFMY